VKTLLPICVLMISLIAGEGLSSPFGSPKSFSSVSQSSSMSSSRPSSSSPYSSVPSSSRPSSPASSSVPSSPHSSVPSSSPTSSSRPSSPSQSSSVPQSSVPSSHRSSSVPSSQQSSGGSYPPVSGSSSTPSAPSSVASSPIGFSVHFKTYNESLGGYDASCGSLSVLFPEFYTGTYYNDDVLSDVPRYTELMCSPIPQSPFFFIGWADGDTSIPRSFFVDSSNPFIIEAKFNY